MEHRFVSIALFTALIAALGLVPSFQLMSGVPISMQSLGVMLAGTVLGAKRGAAAVLLLQVLVVIGLPLLAGGRGGPGILAGPSVGFFIGWLPAAYVTGLVVERWRARSLTLVAAVAALLGGIVVMYVFGIIGMAWALERSLPQAALLSLPFIPGDAVKCVLTGLITNAVARARPSYLMSRQ
ncbi:BioY family transporter [Thioclava sp. SK-1]|uniref:biotin transporter BioY n=1 Tax=Thioclava sp. SK-1 TaxID=1889770 RepID=UPI000826813C|nr:biotin transporter BioY [Thioclava sp. SK-1]OCX58196.1 BioY family transporter [Thioclava sp. SK-1]